MIAVRIPASSLELYTYPVLTTTSQPKVTYNLSENAQVAAVIVIVWKSHTLTVEVRSSASGQSTICQPDQGVSTFYSILEVDCAGAIGDQIVLTEHVDPTTFTIRKLAIFGVANGANICSVSSVPLVEIPDMTAQVGAIPSTYSFSAQTTSCGLATFYLNEDYAWAAISNNASSETATITVAPISNDE